MTKVHSILVVMLVLFAASLACSMPLNPVPTITSVSTSISTGTPLAATPTNASPLVTVTNPPSAPSPTPTSTQSVQVTPTATAKGASCNLAVFISDLTYPDDTVVPAGANFEKKWQLKNVGSCTWTSDYKLIFVSGDAMGGPGSSRLTTGTVPPGNSVAAAVNLVAPAAAGKYQGNFKLQSSDGTTFGIDTSGNVFYVRIIVEGQNIQPNDANPVDEPSIPELVRNLKLTNPFMKGNDVTMLQKRLLDRGYTIIGSADGVFGNKTDAAVRQFQTDQGLPVDGIVGKKTWTALWN